MNVRVGFVGTKGDEGLGEREEREEREWLIRVEWPGLVSHASTARYPVEGGGRMRTRAGGYKGDDDGKARGL